MQEGERKVEATGSTRFHNILWNKIGSDRSSWNIDGLKHSVFAKSPTVAQIYDSDTEIQTIYYNITEVYRLNTLVGSLRYLNFLLKYSLFYHIVELYPNPTHFWGIPYLITLLSNSHFQDIAETYPLVTHWWSILDLFTLVSSSQFQLIAEL